jgi:HEPN domain-containing protein
LKFEISGEFEGVKEVTEFCRDLEEEVNRARYPSRQKGKILTPMEAFPEHYTKKIQEQTKKEFQRLVDYINSKYSPNWNEQEKEEGNPEK